MESQPITRKDVYQLLRQLSRDRVPEKSPLANLRLVGQSLAAAGLSSNDKARHVELGRLLLEIAEVQLEHLRREFGIPAKAGGGNHRQQIREDFSRGQRELEAWSALYHIYLRPDLDLGLNGFAALVTNVHKRTVQRRLSRGVDALVARLQELEHEATLNGAVSQAARPKGARAASSWVGSDAVVDRAVPLLCGSDEPSILHLTGPGGIGKTELARYIVARAMEAGVFQDALWVSARGEPPNMGARACDFGWFLAVNGASDQLHIRKLCSQCPTVIVVDGLDEPELFEYLVASLGEIRWPSKVLLTGRVDAWTIDHVRPLAVPPLEPLDAAALLRREASVAGMEEIARARAEDLAPLLRATAGHPGAIRLAVSMLRWTELASVVADFEAGRGLPAELYADMWATIWRRAEPTVRELVLAVVRASGHTGASAMTLEWSPSDNGHRPDKALQRAVACGLLAVRGTPSRRSYVPGLFVDRFLAQEGLVRRESLAACSSIPTAASYLGSADMRSRS